MSDEEKHMKETSDSSIYYILGGVVLVAAIAGFFLLKPKEKAPGAPAATQQVQSPPQAAASPAPITKFACENQYYNPVVGLPQYFVSAEGVDVKKSGNVSCEFTFSVKDRVVATERVTTQVSANEVRGGGTFRCQTPAIELAKGVATDVKVTMTNDDKLSTSCTQSFVFP
ncbi:hypothetical protein A2Z33_00495 [Candidatus Gottesmanbacteria bacterium RBG_16_52_11]|uniref:Uncharacterized protein n=1 Tax=Candidatus Gottesmanbacteria bacterium RBG_16_52_11 TaxID=1798374 RepID=A0A1F5YN32_9BACT|nr:MAG: hypothetical protein A2Z33_00495 [Candidatus Gottesmanbacteria bacterium RBG_16_52_11]